MGMGGIRFEAKNKPSTMSLSCTAAVFFFNIFLSLFFPFLPGTESHSLLVISSAQQPLKIEILICKSEHVFHTFSSSYVIIH